MKYLKKRVATFLDDQDGATFVEFLLILPLIFFWLCAGFVFFDVFSASIQSKRSTYTITDSLSRQSELDNVFLARMHDVFQAMVDKTGLDSGMRVSAIQNTGIEYAVMWSVAEGKFEDVVYSGESVDGPSAAKIDAYVPILEVGEEMVMVETYRYYKPLFDWVGIKERNLESVAVAYIRNSPHLDNTDIPRPSSGGDNPDGGELGDDPTDP
jgi:Flp pilus assembly pilin Flp